jgi:glycerophosphoryl diester phosphodiesterase
VIGLYLSIVIVALLLIVLFLIMPALGRREKRKVLPGIYAHRGLFNNHEGIPENSMAAFRRAVEHGYGIETDIHLSADGVCVLHHDDTLSRICGVDGLLREKTADELTKLPLLGTSETVPLFSEFLKLVDGRVPLVLELKSEAGNREALVDAVLRELENYTGPYCIESFDPRILAVLRRRAPHIVRGQLAGKLGRGVVSPLTEFLLRNLMLNVIVRPDFIAYRYNDRKNPIFRLNTSLLGATRVYWTIRTPEDFATAQADGGIPIFEGFEP